MEEEKFGILIVDDEKTNLDVLSHILGEEYNVFIAKSGEGAISKAQSIRPDVILLDIVMPDMNGFEVIVRLKEAPETRDIPVMFITGLNSAENEERGIRLGAADYITKPFNAAVVKARVATQMTILRQVRLIEKIGMLDSTTSLPNRKFFDAKIEMEWQRAHRERIFLGLLLIDIDHFKQYNDKYGYLQGDAILQAVADVLMVSSGHSENCVARYEDDTFAILLPNAALSEVLCFSEQIRSAVESLRQPLLDSTNVSGITCSIGAVSVVPENDRRADDFLEKATQLLAAAKTNGRNRVCS